MAPQNVSPRFSKQAEVEVMDLLMQLRLLVPTKHTLKVTMIGRTVDDLKRNHPSERIRQLAEEIINEWRKTMYEKVEKATTVTSQDGQEKQYPTGSTFNSLDVSTNDTKIIVAKSTNWKKPTAITRRDDKGTTCMPASFFNEVTLDNQTPSTRPPEMGNSKNTNEGKDEMKLQKQYFFSANIPKSYVSNKQEKQFDDLPKLLQATKRKLHESYQKYENANKHRTTKFIDFHDLPKKNSTTCVPKVIDKIPQAYHKLTL